LPTRRLNEAPRIYHAGRRRGLWPLVARTTAEQNGRNLPSNVPVGMARLAAFLQGLQQLGWIDGQNVRIDDSRGGQDVERMRKFAAELVALAPDVIRQ
jgi:hypothetical protein